MVITLDLADQQPPKALDARSVSAQQRETGSEVVYLDCESPSPIESFSTVSVRLEDVFRAVSEVHE